MLQFLPMPTGVHVHELLQSSPTVHSLSDRNGPRMVRWRREMASDTIRTVMAWTGARRHAVSR